MLAMTQAIMPMAAARTATLRWALVLMLVSILVWTLDWTLVMIVVTSLSPGRFMSFRPGLLAPARVSASSAARWPGAWQREEWDAWDGLL
jgi:hypothetical protein